MIKLFKSFYSRQSIRAKMMTNTLFVVVITVFALSYSNMNVLRSSMMEVNNQYTDQLIEQVNIRIETYIKEIDRITDFIINAPEVQLYFSNSLDNQSKSYMIENVESTLDLYASNEQNIMGILVVNKYGEMITTNMKKIEDNSLAMEYWFIQTVTDPEQIHLFSQPIGRNVKSIYDYYNADNIISFTKAILDEKGDVIGVVLIDMKLDVVENIINSAILGKSGFLYVVEADGDMVYAPINSLVYRISSSVIRNEGAINIKSEQYKIINRLSEYTGWYVVGVFPTNETMDIILKVLIYFILYAAIILIVAIFLSGYLSRTLTKPISILRSLMARAEEGELDVQFDIKYNDEIGMLGQSFNKMIEAIKNLIGQVYTAQKNKREAELKAFQAQIKPHFLYNTLDTINWMAIEQGSEDISKMITDLTNLFRISLSKGNEIISLENEILHVQSYLDIQMVRYEKQFEYKLELDAQIKHLRVLKLILQPIVENAIYHGIKENKRKGFIHISVNIVNNQLIFIVADNGLGIEGARLTELKEVLAGKEYRTDDFGIGMVNVNERLRLNFGNDYGIKIESERQKGTTVTICHPMIDYRED